VQRSKSDLASYAAQVGGCWGSGRPGPAAPVAVRCTPSSKRSMQASSPPSSTAAPPRVCAGSGAQAAAPSGGRCGGPSQAWQPARISQRQRWLWHGHSPASGPAAHRPQPQAAGAAAGTDHGGAGCHRRARRCQGWQHPAAAQQLCQRGRWGQGCALPPARRARCSPAPPARHRSGSSRHAQARWGRGQPLSCAQAGTDCSELQSSEWWAAARRRSQSTTWSLKGAIEGHSVCFEAANAGLSLDRRSAMPKFDRLLRVEAGAGVGARGARGTAD
jgi:hypothetical protein